MNEMTIFKLIKTYSLPRLLHGCEMWPIESVDMHELDVIWNHGFRHLSLLLAWQCKAASVFLSIYAFVFCDQGKTVDVL